MFARGREAAVLDHLKRHPDQGPGEYLRLGDGGRTENELGVAAVKAADPVQAADDLDHVAAQDTLVGMGLVNHHQLEVFKKFLPLLVERQQAQMNHIRVGNHDGRRRLPDLLAFAGRGIPVINGRKALGELGEHRGPFFHGLALVLFQGFNGK